MRSINLVRTIAYLEPMLVWNEQIHDLTRERDVSDDRVTFVDTADLEVAVPFIAHAVANTHDFLQVVLDCHNMHDISIDNDEPRGPDVEIEIRDRKNWLS